MAEQNNPKLAKVLDIIGIIEFILFFAFWILTIWIKDGWVEKVIYSDLIAIAGTFFLYWLLCYVPED